MKLPVDRIRDVCVGMLILGDVFWFSLAEVVAYYIRLDSGFFDEILMTSDMTYVAYAGHFFFGLILYVFLASYRGIFTDIHLFRPRAALAGLLKICAYWFVVYLFVSLVFKLSPPVSRVYVLLNALLAIPFVYFGRVFVCELLSRTAWAEQIRQKIIFVGWDRQMQGLIRAVRHDLHHPYQILGWVRTRSDGAGTEFEKLPQLGLYKDFDEIMENLSPDMVILADMDVGMEVIDQMINTCGRERVDFKLGSSFYPVFASGLRVQTISGVPLLGIQELAIEKWYNRIAKRVIDILGALVGLVLAAPMMALFALLVYRESPGPILYRQVRSGRRGQDFEIIKIRSMRVDAEKDGVGWSTQEDPRRLKVGSFMRKWNIDELPQFWNVLRGEMSLVGPRPERPELIADFKYQIRLYNVRHGVKPGVTGWAQVNGWRGDTDLDERIRHDLYYMENWSVWMDIQIMIMTVFRYKNAH